MKNNKEFLLNIFKKDNYIIDADDYSKPSALNKIDNVSLDYIINNDIEKKELGIRNGNTFTGVSGIMYFCSN